MQFLKEKYQCSLWQLAKLTENYFFTREEHIFSHLLHCSTHTLAAGPALTSAGPDLKHFCGAPLSGV